MTAPRNNPKAFSEWYEQDYFLRPRHPYVKTGTVLATIVICMAAVAAAWFWSRGRIAFQAGPLSAPHAMLTENCAACHTEAFATARRLLPANHDARAVPDAVCLRCHDAGAHNPYQTLYSGSDNQAADCAACHREHRGGPTLTRIDDAHCTTCHANLTTSDGRHRFHATITHFDNNHPALGAWRGELRDPGTLKFNHKVHLGLPEALKDVSPERLDGMSQPLQQLKSQSCTYCHQPDAERRYLLPVSYESHCAACHTLVARPRGDPPAGVMQFAKVPHPRRGETAAVVRGALLEFAWRAIAKVQPAPGQPPERPPVLQRGLPPLPADQRERARQLARQTEDRLFAPDGGDVLLALERPLFRMLGGCAYCHQEETRPDNRPDSLPTYAPPRLRGRWEGVSFPHERFGPAGRRSDADQADRDRWFPYARFHHESHRMLDCAACHSAAASTQTSDVLMPTIDTCRQCHNRATAGVRSDCLECHNYHDRLGEPHGLRGRMTVEQVLGLTKPSSR